MVVWGEGFVGDGAMAKTQSQGSESIVQWQRHKQGKMGAETSKWGQPAPCSNCVQAKISVWLEQKEGTWRLQRQRVTRL